MKLTLLLLSVLAAGAAASSLGGLAREVSNAEAFGGDIWAVLVAGSNGWSNYRHQADICHAYQILKEHGVADEHIIVMMYDDIADNSQNPLPGQIINKPDGPDVYHGVPKDYVGDEVSANNFLRVLEGDAQLKAKGKKVLQSTNKDHVFVYFSDHGAPGLVAMPVGTLYAKDLIKTLDKLHANDAYKRMVIYVEACESGSMFKDLLKEDHRIYGVTASNERESSWGYYCGSDKRFSYTCLGDEFSVKWLEDSDAVGDLKQSTLAQQVERVREATEKSHVCHYGDHSFNDSSLADFQGAKATKPRPASDETQGHAVVSFDVPLVQAELKAQITNSELDSRKLVALKQGREFVEVVNEALAATLEDRHNLPYPLLGAMEPLKRHDCYQALVNTYQKHCFNVSVHSYALRALYLFANVCANLPDESPATLEPVSQTIARFCQRNVADHPFRAIV